jgi:hypothetical protein
VNTVLRVALVAWTLLFVAIACAPLYRFGRDERPFTLARCPNVPP